ncbi:MAG: outer membrane beta-barrel protein [Pseudomonadota bacterium]
MKKILTTCVVAAACLAAPAFAQGYVGAGLGSSKISGFDAGTTTGGNTSKGMAKIYGGFQFTPNWGLELQYSDLGRRDVATAGVGTGSFRASQFSIAGTGTLPLTSGFSVLGKLGVSANRINGSGTTGSGNATSALIGVGVAYNITPALSARLEYEDFGAMAKNAPGGTVRANAYSLSLKYAF